MHNLIYTFDSNPRQKAPPVPRLQSNLEAIQEEMLPEPPEHMDITQSWIELLQPKMDHVETSDVMV